MRYLYLVFTLYFNSTTFHWEILFSHYLTATVIFYIQNMLHCYRSNYPAVAYIMELAPPATTFKCWICVNSSVVITTQYYNIDNSERGHSSSYINILILSADFTLNKIESRTLNTQFLHCWIASFCHNVHKVCNEWSRSIKQKNGNASVH